MGRGGGVGDKNLLLEVTVNSKGKNSEDFCPNYVQEFGLSAFLSLIVLDRFIFLHTSANYGY